MNEHSSRSHAIFTITIECSEKGVDGNQVMRMGKLHLVDLAVCICESEVFPRKWEAPGAEAVASCDIGCLCSGIRETGQDWSHGSAFKGSNEDQSFSVHAG